MEARSGTSAGGKIIQPSDLTVVIPALNEEGAIGKVIRELKDEGYENIIVVDGGSTDNTVRVAREEGVLVLSQEGRGKNNAIMTAVQHIPTEYTLIMDGDYTYDPKSIKSLLAQGDYFDEVIGIRREVAHIPRLHRLGNWTITAIFNMLFGTSLHDVCSGMYLVRTEILREYDFNTRGFSLEVGVAAHTASMSGRITDVGVNYRERIGEPKLRSWHGFEIVFDAFRLAWGYNPTFFIFFISSLIMIPSLIILGFVAYRYFIFGVSHFVWAIIGTVGAGIGVVSLMLAVMSLFIKRVEYRLLECVKNGNGK